MATTHKHIDMHNPIESIVNYILGWICILGSFASNALLGDASLPCPTPVHLNIDYIFYDFLITQLTHIIQIIGIIGGLYLTWRGKKKLENAKTDQ